MTLAVRDAHCARRPQLRRREASAAVSDRAPAAAPRHDDLPLSAESRRRDNLGQGLYGSAHGSSVMTDTPQVLLAHYLKTLKLPTFLRVNGCPNPRKDGGRGSSAHAGSP